MAIIMNKRDDRTELQQRIAAELRENQASKSKDLDLIASEYDVNKSEYLKDTAESTVPGWVWLVGLIISAGAAFLIVKFIIR